MLPNYLRILIEKHYKITSGRKNFNAHHDRILKTIKIVKKYFSIKKNLKI